MLTRVLLTGALGAVCLLLSTSGASAAQHQNANIYSNWNWTGSGFWNVDQNLRIDKKAPATFWAEQILWRGLSGGAYLGLQTNGTRFDGSVGDTAVFSIWDANGARGSTCETFGGEGSGWSCRIPYSPAVGSLYRLRIWRQEADSRGQWWAAWVKSQASGNEEFIGSIRAPLGATSIGDTTNFVEYFGTQVACNKVPQSKVVWTQPAANSRGGGVYDYSSSYSSSSFGACVTGSATPVDLGWTRGVSVLHGSLDIFPFPNELAFVGQQYLDFYGRPIPAADATWLIAALRNGSATATGEIDSILKSAEADRGILGVVRLYYAAFDRHPDAGARAWLNKPLGSVAAGLLDSSEGRRDLPANPEAFVRKLYTNALNRNASASEVSYWADRVRSNGRASVLLSISDSSEHRSIRRGQAPVQALYLAMLHRAADPGALDYWVPVLAETPAASAFLIETIRKSAEYDRLIN